MEICSFCCCLLELDGEFLLKQNDMLMFDV